MHKSVKCFMSKMYAVYKEQVHLTGYLAILAILWAIYSHITAFIDAADANTITSASHSVDIKALQIWKATIDVNFADMKREIDDIHDILVGHK